MWPFRKTLPESDLVIRLEKLERSHRDLILDWEETYEKFRLLYMRLNKRVERESPPPVQVTQGELLDPISAAILRERGEV
jgi:succinate dehydrogenase/fumarate reductase-like Fe-S protein